MPSDLVCVTIYFLGINSEKEELHIELKCLKLLIRLFSCECAVASHISQLCMVSITVENMAAKTMNICVMCPWYFKVTHASWWLKKINKNLPHTVLLTIIDTHEVQGHAAKYILKRNESHETFYSLDFFYIYIFPVCDMKAQLKNNNLKQ